MQKNKTKINIVQQAKNATFCKIPVTTEFFVNFVRHILYEH
jgi:hypothetical protein